MSMVQALSISHPSHDVVFIGEAETLLFTRHDRSHARTTITRHTESRRSTSCTAFMAVSLADQTVASHVAMGPPQATSVNPFILDLTSRQRATKDAKPLLFVLSAERADEVRRSPSMQHCAVHGLDAHDAHLNLASVLIEMSRGGLQEEHEQRRAVIVETTKLSWEAKVDRRVQITNEIVIRVWSRISLPEIL